MCRKLSNSWHCICRAPHQIYTQVQTSWVPFTYFPPIFVLPSFNRIDKNEAIQLFRSLIFHAAMTGQLASTLRSKILRLLLLHWRPDVIAEEVHCHFTTVYRIQKNLFMFDSSFRPQFRSKDASRKIFSVAEDFLITYLKQQSWTMQKEMMWFLWKEWDIHVHRFTIFRILKKRHWSNKKKQRVSIRQNDELRLNWIADLLQLTAEQLVFVDETLFNETKEWRHQVYAPVGEVARSRCDRFSKQHFKHSVEDYIFEADIRVLKRDLEADTIDFDW